MRLDLKNYFVNFTPKSEMTDGDITRLNRMYQCPNFIDEETDWDLAKRAGGETVTVPDTGTDTPALEGNSTDSAITTFIANGSAKTERRATAPVISEVVTTGSAEAKRSSIASASTEKTLTTTDASGIIGVKVKVKGKASGRNSDIVADNTTNVEETEAQAPILQTSSAETAEPGVEGPSEEASDDDLDDSESYKVLMEEEMEIEENPRAKSTKLTAAEEQQDSITDDSLSRSPRLLDRLTESISFVLKPWCKLYYQLKFLSAALKGLR